MATTWPRILGLDGLQNHVIIRGVGSVTATTHQLNSGYTYGTSGRAAVIMWFVATETANLTDIWFKVSAYGGTWASTDGNINWEIRAGLNGTRIPGTTQTASGTFALDGTTGWKKITGLTASLTVGKMYCVILYDSDGGATNNVTIVAGLGSSNSNTPDLGTEIGTTTNGFSSAYSVTGASAACMVKVGSTYVAGQIWDTTSTVTTGTYERGAYFAPPEDCTLVGFAVTQDTTIFLDGHTLNVYADGVAPGGSKLATFSPAQTALGGATSPSMGHVLLPASSWLDLSANTWYRVVLKPASNLTVPRKQTAGGSPDATLLAQSMPFGGNFYWTEDSSGSWSNNTSAIPAFGPILVPRTGSGGGRGGRIRQGSRF